MMMKTKEADASTVNGASTGVSWDINRCSAGAAATSVWWDINRCPLPNDVDVRRVSPFIKRALEKLGYTGALTTTAIGILTDVPHDFLTQVYSSGIAIHHIPLGLNGSFNSLDYSFLRVYLLILEVSETDIFELSSAVIYWTWDNLPPSNIMLISNELIFSSLLDKLCGFGYNVVRSIFPDDPQQAASASTS
ncbi:unnamed protein product [Arabidopsis thaliana]|uniref:NYN domain-containing protein n=1 Tax=Arabidopsis thaliana TaxID=3702 RepID=A0A5S9Y8B3_ARATH|nr:unnamed protein product [Arabidopsis thaliana]